MSEHPLLVMGNKNYSSWSLRAWLFLRHSGVDFRELRLPLDTPEFAERIGALSPTGRVPVLHHDGLVVWDSLAICEYTSETFLDGRGWPGTRRARAEARSASAEMHSGFAALRQHLPMNCRRHLPGYPVAQAAASDISRVQSLWRQLREAHGGPFLCGGFGIVDAMYAPVALRFAGYDVALEPVARDYVDTLLALPALQTWIADARAETEVVAADEV
ncbi:MAG TPA: glutathione S-transferase family protein [Xanthomonadaceae bacterium]|nr:glutathione S-transferase family protein [Xanthomonadaceae bacterium]